MKLLFMGDSVTDSSRFNREDPHSTGRGYVFLLESEFGAKHTEYEFLNCGINGNRVVDLLARVKKDCINHNPDIVTLLIGVNDVSHEIYHQNGVGAELFEELYTILLREITAALPQVKLMIMAPYVLPGSITDVDYAGFTSGVAQRREIACRLAEKFHAGYVDLQKVFDEALTRAPVSHWCQDGVHPTPAGHALIAAAWKQVWNQ